MTPAPVIETLSTIYDPASLQHYPGIAMSRFGLNPNSETLYRIVFASSRLHIVNYQSTGGYVADPNSTTQDAWRNTTGGNWRSEWRPRYPAIGDQWILEKWVPAFEFHGMGRARWEREFPWLPWKERGDFEHVHTFESCTPADANLDKLIMWINEGKNRSMQEIGAACRAEYEQETVNTRREIGDRIRNVLPAFGTAAISGRASRGTKTDSVKLSAEEMKSRGFVIAYDEEKNGALPVGKAVSNLTSGGASTTEHWEVPVTL